mmetsp:Transcript_31492/g.28676  ORF Transcript_31492/g.28676 Transcript_31492/m.28676 type:complete len:132 (-) Transcript_31492:75-470(-)
MVFKAESGPTGTQYALRVYPYKKGKVNSSFNREARFQRLNHPNVIRIEDCQSQYSIFCSASQVNYPASVLVMEYLSKGTLADVLSHKSFRDDEKLVRTYFHQLINGISYIHSKSLAHMDIKLNNLMLNSEY